jgi:hypothetical protein
VQGVAEGALAHRPVERRDPGGEIGIEVGRRFTMAAGRLADVAALGEPGGEGRQAAGVAPDQAGGVAEVYTRGPATGAEVGEIGGEARRVGDQAVEFGPIHHAATRASLAACRACRRRLGASP